MQAMSETRLTKSEERRLLKWGVEIVTIYDSALQYGDIAFVEGPNGRDLKLTEGVNNLNQQITSALVTALGADPLNINYGFGGFDAIANERNPILLREQLRFAVLGVLQADPRIVKVLRVLIGNEIELFYRGEVVPVAPKKATGTPDGAGDRYTTTRIEAQFTIGTDKVIRLVVGPVAGVTS